MPSTNQLIHDAALRDAIARDRYADKLSSEILAILRRSEVDIEDQIRRRIVRLGPIAGQVSGRGLDTTQRLADFLASVRGINADGYDGMRSKLEEELFGRAVTEATNAKRGIASAISAVDVKLDLRTPPLPLLRSFVTEKPFDGRLLGEWVDRVRDNRWAGIRDAVERTTEQGLAQGETIDQMARRLQGAFSLSRRDATSLVRTSVAHVAAGSREAMYQANADIIKAVAWVSTLDTSTTSGCFPADMRVVPIGTLLGASARQYEGEFLVVRTASGNEMRCTPNHPVLTSRGWLPANEIQPGADVLYSVSQEGLCVECREHVGVPPTIAEIANAILKPARANVLVKRSSEGDFHGDGMGGDHEIHIAYSDRHLRQKLVTQLDHDVLESALALSQLARGLFGCSRSAEVFEARLPPDMATQRCVVPTENGVQAALAEPERSADFRGEFAPPVSLQDLSFIGALHGPAPGESGHCAGVDQEPGCRGGRGAVLPCQACGRLAVAVSGDDVLSVGREFGSEQVFNLQTSSGAYIAGGMVVHNCKLRDGKLYDLQTKAPVGHDLPWDGGPGRRHWQCRSTSVPVLGTWEDLGLDGSKIGPGARAAMDGEAAGNEDYEKWLRRQPIGVQRGALGDARGDAFNRGASLADATSKPLARLLEEFAPKSGTSVPGAGTAAAVAEQTLASLLSGGVEAPRFKKASEAEAWLRGRYASEVDLGRVSLAVAQEIADGVAAVMSGFGTRVDEIGKIAGTKYRECLGVYLFNPYARDRGKILLRQRMDLARNKRADDWALKKATKELGDIAPKRAFAMSDSQRPVFSLAAHEAGHAIYYQSFGGTLWEARVRKAIDSGTVTLRDRLAVSLYARKNLAELWSEVTALVADGRSSEVPESILDIYRFVIEAVIEQGRTN